VAGGAVDQLAEEHPSRPPLQLLQRDGDGDNRAIPAHGREVRRVVDEIEGFGECVAVAFVFVAGVFLAELIHRARLRHGREDAFEEVGGFAVELAGEVHLPVGGEPVLESPPGPRQPVFGIVRWGVDVTVGCKSDPGFLHRQWLRLESQFDERVLGRHREHVVDFGHVLTGDPPRRQLPTCQRHRQRGVRDAGFRFPRREVQRAGQESDGSAVSLAGGQSS